MADHLADALTGRGHRFECRQPTAPSTARPGTPGVSSEVVLQGQADTEHFDIIELLSIRDRLTAVTPQIGAVATQPIPAAPVAKAIPRRVLPRDFRLKGWPWEGMQVNRPQVVGHYTNDIVYDRLTPGLLEQLQLRNPKDESGERKHKHHQWLSDDFGQPELYTHLVGAIAIMNTVRINKPERAWPEFKRRLQRWRPKLNTTLDIGLDDEGD